MQRGGRKRGATVATWVDDATCVAGAQVASMAQPPTRRQSALLWSSLPPWVKIAPWFVCSPQSGSVWLYTQPPQTCGAHVGSLGTGCGVRAATGAPYSSKTKIMIRRWRAPRVAQCRAQCCRRFRGRPSGAEASRPGPTSFFSRLSMEAGVRLNLGGGTHWQGTASSPKMSARSSIRGWEKT